MKKNFLHPLPLSGIKHSIRLACTALCLLLGSQSKATIAVTSGTNGTNICSNKAVGGIAAGYTTLGTITVAERANNDFGGGGTGFNTITLTLPAGWQFNTAVMPTLNGVAAAHFTNLSGSSFTGTSYTILVRMTATAARDSFTISGLQVQATSGSSAAGNLMASAVTGTFTGIVVSTTNFASLSLRAAIAPSITISASPSGPICPGTLVTFTSVPVTDSVVAYQWMRNGTADAGQVSASDTSSMLANGNTISLSMTPGGCVTSTAPVSSNVITTTVNALPAAITITGGGTSCDNATLVASNGGDGTLYYEGVFAGATSTADPSSTVTVSDLGVHTYYFRAQSAGGCWGAESSVTTTINPTPSAPGLTPSGSGVVCLGDSTKYAASALMSAANIMSEDFNSGLGAWTITNISGVANSYWQVRNSPGYGNYTPGDGSPMLEAAADATSGTTNTIITSPSFSTIGFTDATLTFNQYYHYYSADTNVTVDYSIDGGTTWTTMLNQAGADAGSTSWSSLTPSTTVAFPTAAIGQPDVMLRWNYNSTWGWYWAIDNISVQGTPILSYAWAGVSGATGLSCTTCDTTTIIPAAAGINTYSVSTSYLGCASSATFAMTVNPLPFVDAILGAADICIGSGTTLFNSVSGGTWATSDASVATADAPTGAIAGTAVGTATISYTVTDGNGCMNTATMAETVHALPVVSAIVGNDAVCAGSTLPLSDFTAGGTWSSADVSIATVNSTGTVTGIATGNTNISYIVTDIWGCSGYAAQNVLVGAAIPTVTQFPLSGSVTLCHVASANIVTVTSGTGLSYQWDSSGIAIPGATNADYTAAAPGLYFLTVSNGACSSTLSPMHVWAAPSAAIAYTASGNFLYTGSFSAYQWLRNGMPVAGATASVLSSPVPGVYSVVVGDMNGCTDTSATYTIEGAAEGVAISGNSDAISIYPVPVSTTLHIAASAPVSVKVYSTDGKLVTEAHGVNSISTASLPNGVYMLSIFNGQGELLKNARFSKVD